MSHFDEWAENFHSLRLHIMSVNMDTVPLVASMGKFLKKALMGNSITVGGQISLDKLVKPRQGPSRLKHAFLKFTFNIFRMRAQGIIEALPTITVQETEGPMIPLMDVEVEHCAAVIIAAFLNPSKSTV